MAYVPSTGAGTRTITVNMGRLSEPANARWYNPTNGSCTAIEGSPLANSGSRDFTTPGDNGTGTNDWVLVLEAAPRLGHRVPQRNEPKCGADSVRETIHGERAVWESMLIGLAWMVAWTACGWSSAVASESSGNVTRLSEHLLVYQGPSIYGQAVTEIERGDAVGPDSVDIVLL